ncbi:MAG: glucose-1-phosphate thymidylyltransferase [Bacillota bacterium]
MKALVLCAGRGSRLRPLTHTRAKASLPVAGRPVLHHVLDYLLRHGFQEVGVVIGPQQDDLRHLLPLSTGQQVRLIVQEEPRGIAHAVSVARPFLGEEPFLLYLGDNLTGEALTPALDRFQQAKPAALITLREVENPREFGVAEMAGERVVRVVEKPANPPSNLAVAGIYLFTSAVHQAIEELKPSARGELEITDAIARLIDWQQPVLGYRMQGWWQDMGTVEGLLAANTLLLDQIQTQVDPSAVLDEVKIQGRVCIGPGAVLRRVRLRGPLMIGAGSRLFDAYVGPYTSVGDAARIERVAVESSILLPGCRLEGPNLWLEDSLVGSRAEIWAREGRSFSLLVGDDAHLSIPPDRR